MLTGLESMTSGSVSIMGMRYPEQWSEIQNLIGLCPQKGIVFPDLTTREHLEFYGRLKGVEGDELTKHVQE